MLGVVSFKAHRGGPGHNGPLWMWRFHVWNQFTRSLRFWTGSPLLSMISTLGSVLYMISVIVVAPYILLVKDKLMTHEMGRNVYAFTVGIVINGCYSFTCTIVTLGFPKVVVSLVLSCLTSTINLNSKITLYFFLEIQTSQKLLDITR